MTQTTALSDTNRALLQIVYELMSQRGAWPTLTAVDLRADRDLGIEYVEAALLVIPPEYIARPWRVHGFYDNDEIRLTLRGVAECQGGPEDLALLEQLVQWIVELERRDRGTEEDNLVADSVAFAAYLGIDLEPSRATNGKHDDGASDSTTSGHFGNSPQPSYNPLLQDASVPAAAPTMSAEIESARTRLVRVRILADLLPNFWAGAGWPTDKPWLWKYTLSRKRMRPYRHIENLGALLEYVDSERRDRLAAAAAVAHDIPVIDHLLPQEFDPGAVMLKSPPSGLPGTDDGAPPQSRSPHVKDLDIFLTLLRQEIVDAVAAFVRADKFDDAIFAAFRRVEHEVQKRTGNLAIGNDLINAAFRDMSSPIRVSERAQDKDRMIQLFAGAVGLFKGDRSHKDRPLLPCRSLRECLRVLAHASSLLDLLDRDIDRAPFIRGYEHHQGDTLTLSVERAGAQVDVWLDEATLLEKIAFKAGTVVVNVAGVPIGEHRVHLVEGTRQGSARSVWLTREPGRSSWYRVVEVNLPLYSDALGERQLNVTGIRLAVTEAGVVTERIVPTQESYQVGHYVDWHWATTAVGTGPAWERDPVGGELNQLWDGSSLFDGQPVAPAYAQRLMNISLEPADLRLRCGDRVPLRVLGHLTDGTATWTELLDNANVAPANQRVAFFNGGAVIAKDPGTTTLRCLYADCYAEATVEIAAHPRGTVTKFLTGLPPVSGIAWTPLGLVASTRGTDLWRVGGDGVYQLIAATPRLPTNNLGTDTVAARDDGELAVRLVGQRNILVLHNDDGYSSSHWVAPDADGTPMAFVWDGQDVIVAMDTGSVYRVNMNGAAKLAAVVEGVPVALSRTDDSLFVLCGPRGSAAQTHAGAYLWQVQFDDPSQSADLLESHELPSLSGVLTTQSDVLLSEFHGGRLLRLRDNQLSVVATGMTNPCQLAISEKGDIYVAEFGAGAIRRILA